MQVYTTKELKEKIISNDYSAELCLQHAMKIIDALEKELDVYMNLLKKNPPQ